MSGSPKSVLINPSERATSADVNRLQQLGAQFLAELLRGQWDTYSGADDLDAGSLDTQTTTQLAPDAAIIPSGLLVRPAVGSFNLGIDPGTIAMLDPDASPDPNDSPYKIFTDAGFPTGLVIGPNTSGSTRIDVVECERVLPFQVFEQDNRDIFANSTGLFTPTNINKIVGSALQYRVRQGTPGSGLPANQTGWVPLMVARVPNGASSNDSCTFWDVRPLLEDRTFPVHAGSDYPQWRRANWQVNTSFSGGKAILTGVVDTTATDLVSVPNVAGKRRLGGRLRTSGISADKPGTIDGLDLNDSNNWSSSMTTNLGYLYLLENFGGLPRWVRYADATTGNRVPRSPRGLCCVSVTPPGHFYGSPQAAIGLPASMGLGTGTTSRGICFGVVKYTAGLAGSTMCDGRTQWNSAAYPAVTGTVVGTTAPFTVTFTMFEEAGYLPGAKALYCDLNIIFIASGTPDVTVTITVSDTSNNAVTTVGVANFTAVATTNIWSTRLKVPVPTNYPFQGVSSWPGFQIVASVSSTNTITAAGSPSLQVLGWDLF